MFYAIIGFLALILNLIINRDSLKIQRDLAGESDSEQKVISRYRTFLIISNCYFLIDIGWGLLYENRHINAIFPFLYIDCILYFLFMFMTMVGWIRYIVAYLDKRNLRSKALLHAVWIIFTLAVIYLIVNYFYPFIFHLMKIMNIFQNQADILHSFCRLLFIW